MNDRPDTTLEFLDARTREHVSRIAPREVWEPLFARINLHPPDGRGQLLHRFSPFTLLYPAGWSEAFNSVRRDAVDRALEAHAMIILWAFLDDRRRDKQLILSAREEEFVPRLYEIACHAISTLDGLPEEWHFYKSEIEMRYDKAQRQGYAPTSGGDIESAQRKSADRSGHGLLAAFAVATIGGASVDQLDSMRYAFDDLAIGLQWSDDISDWREDLAISGDNLLFDLLKLSGLDVSVHPRDERLHANVGFALLETGALARAYAESRRRLAAAAEKHEALGCSSLALGIRKLALQVQGTRVSAEARISEVVFAALVSNRGLRSQY